MGKIFSNADGVGLSGTWNPLIASGTATPDQVIAGTTFSNASGTQTGTMPDVTDVTGADGSLSVTTEC